jgi:SAM-dependent methyltransferase
MHPNSLMLFEKYAKPFFRDEMKILEIGPDMFPASYQKLMNHLSLEWHTLDRYDGPSLTFANAGEHSFPIPDESYDITLSGQVIKHVRKPWKWIPELARVTRSGGLVITISPVSWTYHEAPVDCWRIYPDGMNALCEEAALSVELSVWESLERPGFRRYIPGNSLELQRVRERLAYKILGRFGFPVQRSCDTITIGRKSSADS